MAIFREIDREIGRKRVKFVCPEATIVRFYSPSPGAISLAAALCVSERLPSSSSSQEEKERKAVMIHIAEDWWWWHAWSYIALWK